MSAIERLIELFAAHYRWGLHSFKFLVALLAPVIVIWVADWRLRALHETMSDEEPVSPQLPRSGQR